MAQKKDSISAFSDMDFLKIFEPYQGKIFDINPILDLQSKNINALSEIQKSTLSSMKEIAKRQSEIFSDFMQNQSKLTSELLREGKPEDKIAKNAEIIKKSYEDAMSHISEIANMIKKANAETTGILNKRASASISEIRSTVEGVLKKKSA